MDQWYDPGNGSSYVMYLEAPMLEAQGKSHISFPTVKWGLCLLTRKDMEEENSQVLNKGFEHAGS